MLKAACITQGSQTPYMVNMCDSTWGCCISNPECVTMPASLLISLPMLPGITNTCRVGKLSPLLGHSFASQIKEFTKTGDNLVAALCYQFQIPMD